MGLDIFGGGEASAALFGLGSNIIGNMMSYRNAKKLMDRQNSFVERMSNTAYSRATSDMRNAGLNPALMYGNGSAASTPSGGLASTPSFDIENPLNSAMEYRNAKATIANTEANAAFAKEQAKTEASKRENLAADSALKTATKIATDTKLPYETKKMAAEAKTLLSQSLLNDKIREYTGMNAVSQRIQANAASSLSDTARLEYGLDDRYRTVEEKRSEKFYKEHPIQAKFLRGVSEYSKSLGLSGPIVGAGAAYGIGRLKRKRKVGF